MAIKPAARYTLVGAAIVAVILLVLVIVLTRTQLGVDRGGRVAIDQLRGAIQGELTVESFSGGSILSGVTLHGVSIDGPDGRPFVRADSARLAYRLRTFLTGSFVFDRLILHSPEVVIERLPGEEQWNYERIFPGDTAAPDTVASTRVVLLQDLSVEDATVTVRLPWEPDGPVAPEDTARLILESVPGGTVRTLRFEELNGRFPRIVWEAPEEEARLIEIAELSTRAYIWETPAHVEALEGFVTLRDSLVSFDLPDVRLPSSRLSVVGQVIIGDENRYDVQIEGPDVAFGDFQWAYPPLPEEGGGNLRLRIQTQSPGSVLLLAEDARLSTAGTEVSGSFGVVTGDTLYFTNVDLDASPLDLDLLRRLVPTELPLEGLLIGTIEVEGPISSMDTRGDVRFRTFRDGVGAESAVRWAGMVDADGDVSVRGLDAELRNIDLEQVAQFAPGLRLRGSATGRVRATGSLERGVELEGDVALDRETGRSAVRGSGRFAVGGDRSTFDLRFDAEPVALDLLGEQFPDLGRLAGEARGPVTVTGSLEELHVDADILTPAGGVVLRGTFALAGPVPSYRAEGEVREFQLHRVAQDLPETVVTGSFDVVGQGDRPETVDARASLDLLSARVAGVEVRRSSARGAMADGVIRLGSLAIATEVGTLTANGSFGLARGRSGELAVRASATTLTRLEPLLFPDPPAAETAADPDPRFAGSVDADLIVSGSLREWAVRGHAGARNLIYDQLELGAAEVDFDWRPDTVAVVASVDSLSHRYRRMPHAQVTVGWAPEGGTLTGWALGVGSQQLDLSGRFVTNDDRVDLRLARFELVTDEGRWAAPDTVRARIGAGGITVDDLTLVRAPTFARVRAAGTIPWRNARQGPEAMRATLFLGLDSVRIREVLQVAQMDTTIDGVVQGQVRLGGTALAPDMDAQLTARPFRYGTAELDSAGLDMRYRDRRIQTEFAGWRDGASIVYGAGTIPIDLALTDRAARLLDEPITVLVRADSAPAALASFLAPGFRDLAGSLDGELTVVGTSRDPGLEGALTLTDGVALFEPLGVRYRDIDATARMGTGRIVDVDATLATDDGNGRIRGTVDVTRLRDPGLDLAVTARELDATRRRDVVAAATGEARVTGSYTRPVISGDLQIVRGELNLDEIWRQYQIVQLDPSLFHLFDSTAVSFRPDPGNLFLENLVLSDVTITADRDFWLRSQELNVEVTGSLELEVDRQISDLRLTGTLEALTGSYALQLAQGVPGRTFDIRGGTIEFVGTPGIDPDLDIEAGYRIRRAQGDPIDVAAQVSGTLKDPRVSLHSDSDLPLTESDLASYILFGRSGAELTQAESDVLSSGLGLVRPVATGILSNVAQGFLSWTGVVDYVALTTPEYGLEQLGGYWQSQGLAGVFHNTQVEIGIDAGRDVSLVVSGRIPTDTNTAPEENALWRQFGARLEWRFRPTWTTELFVEDRFARTPSFGLSEIDDRKVWGLSLFRDWGY